MPGKIGVVTLKAGMPRVEEARARLQSEIDRAHRTGMIALKIIHGYGASGIGGSLRHAIRRSLRKRMKEGQIRCFVAGEEWDIFEESTRQILDECPELGKDKDLGRYNEGVTIVLL
ncbi:MAG: Smr/MutS family protein [Sedimentisphaerales bacterium]|nr:Smr/MutS family protein [Sedimentisphaerales bacterium]